MLFDYKRLKSRIFKFNRKIRIETEKNKFPSRSFNGLSLNAKRKKKKKERKTIDFKRTISSKKRNTKRLEFFDHSITEPLPGINGTIGIRSIQDRTQRDKSSTMFERRYIPGSETLYNYQSLLPPYVTPFLLNHPRYKFRSLLLSSIASVRGQRGKRGIVLDRSG